MLQINNVNKNNTISKFYINSDKNNSTKEGLFSILFNDENNSADNDDFNNKMKKRNYSNITGSDDELLNKRIKTEHDDLVPSNKDSINDELIDDDGEVIVLKRMHDKEVGLDWNNNDNDFTSGSDEDPFKTPEREEAVNKEVEELNEENEEGTERSLSWAPLRKETPNNVERSGNQFRIQFIPQFTNYRERAAAS
jgi:hypothetical protein